MSTQSRTRTDKRRTTASAAISMREVVKSYGRVRALDGLDLEVARGEVHGFLGPNGCRQVDDDPDPAGHPGP